MYSRTFSFVLLALASCGRGGGEDKVAAVPVEDRIECATGGATEMSRSCAIERSADGTQWTVRHSDGGFRRLAIAADMGVSAADGSGQLTGTALPDGRLEIVVDGDRYRLPSK
jgi:hypothetical protein